jgi:hypothetical protein
MSPAIAIDLIHRCLDASDMLKERIREGDFPRAMALDIEIAAARLVEAADAIADMNRREAA